MEHKTKEEFYRKFTICTNKYNHKIRLVTPSKIVGWIDQNFTENPIRDEIELTEEVLYLIYKTVTINETREMTFERFKKAIKDYEFNKELKS